MRIVLLIFFCVPVFGGQSLITSSSTLRRDLVGYWSFNEGWLSTNYDASSYGNNLTPTNGIGNEVGKIGLSAMMTLSRTQFLSVADSPILRMGPTNRTISAWVKLADKANNRFIVSKDRSGVAGQRDYSLFYRITSDRYAFAIFKATDSQVLVEATSFGAPPTNVWHHIIAWHDNTNAYIQVNNGTVDSAAISGTLQAPGTQPLLIGAFFTAPNNAMNGYIDEVAIWKRVLTSGERAGLYSSGNAANFPTFTTRTLAISDGWTQLASMPEPKQQHGCEALDGLVYVAGGASVTSGNPVTNSVFSYNPADNTWTAKASVPVATQSPVFRAVGTKLYYIGGKAVSAACVTNVYEYDPDLDSWTAKTGMPVGIEDMASAVSGTKIYVTGGLLNVSTYDVCPILQVYDTVANTWSTNLTVMPNPRCLGDFGAAHNGKLYFVSGSTQPSSYPLMADSTRVDEYDVAGDTWTQLASVPFAQSYKEVASVGGYLYTFGGARVWNNGGSRIVMRYHIASDSWTMFPNMPISVMGASVAELDGSIYVSGGANNSPDVANFYRFDP